MCVLEINNNTMQYIIIIINKDDNSINSRISKQWMNKCDVPSSGPSIYLNLMTYIQKKRTQC